ncbi:MAG: peptide chain release factor 1 [Candidatus Margulisiibacteriota bacterium]|jgi:peptide chain release factor 1
MSIKIDTNKLDEVVARFEEIERKISDPEIIQNQELYQELLKKRSELEEIVHDYEKYKKLLTEFSEAKALISDPELKAMAEEEIERINLEIDQTEKILLEFLIPKDPNDLKNSLVEVRSGTGGEEAALFAYEIFRMYTRYAENKNWKIEILSETLASLGGIKEVTFLVSGKGVYSRLKYESGTHRVQRVPTTESAGRVHTSAITVAILPEAEDVDVKIDTKDLKIDTFRASGAGGQHVNKTSSAIRITHLPTNIVVVCQDERSQFQNKDKAMKILKTKLYEQQLREQKEMESSLRKTQVGSGDRSEKIRTYNFPQNRVTDHRINLTLYSLDAVMGGDLEPLINGLIADENLNQLKT